jgi:Ca2+-binding EF-hand superfamily protein
MGRIDAYDLVDFMRKHYLKAGLEDAQEIIKEYSNDGALSFEEFCQLCLPATNNSLRAVAERRADSPYYKPSEPLSYAAESLIVRLLEKELSLQKHRNDTKRELAQSPDFIKVRAFDDISRGRAQISVCDLTLFLERNGFYPRRDDIEAILRRLDHNADQALSYAEFCELTTI